MGLFDRFRTANDESVEVNEVNSGEYPSEARTGKVAAVLFGFFALIITLAIISGLFFGGRAIYRAFLSSDEEQVVQQEQNQTSEESSASQGAENNNQKTQENSANSSENNSPRANNRTNNTPSSGDNIPSTGDEALPATGDPGQ